MIKNAHPLRYRIPLFAFAAMIILLACRVPLDFLQTSGGVLFQDDFTKPYEGWRRAYSPQAASDFVDGAYSLAVYEPSLHTFSTPGMYFSDVLVGVDAQKVSGSDRNLFGIICRYQDENNYYALLVSSDGYYGTFANLDGIFGLIGVELMSATDVLNPSPRVNHVRADCIDDRLTLWANGIQLIEVQDTRLRDGDVGLFVGTFEEDGTEIWFDNFSVVKP